MMGEMVQGLRVLSAIPEVLSSTPSNHMVSSSGVQAYMQNTVYVINLRKMKIMGSSIYAPHGLCSKTTRENFKLVKLVLMIS